KKRYAVLLFSFVCSAIARNCRPSWERSSRSKIDSTFVRTPTGAALDLRTFIDERFPACSSYQASRILTIYIVKQDLDVSTKRGAKPYFKRRMKQENRHSLIHILNSVFYFLLTIHD